MNNAVIPGSTPLGRRRRRFVLGIVSLTAAVALAACSTPADTGGTGEAESIKVGYITLSGPAAASGVEVQKGINLAVAEFNAKGGPQAEAVLCEDNADLNASTACTQKLVTQEGIQYLLIDTSSANALADVEIAKRNDVVTMIAGPRDIALTQGDNPLLVRVNVNAVVEGQGVANQISDVLSPKKVAYIATDNPYGQQEVKTMKETFADAKIDSVYETFFPATQTDFASQVAAVKDSGADLLIMLGQVNQAAIIAKQIQSAGLDINLAAASGAWTPDLVKLAEGAMDGQYGWTTFPNGDDEVSKDFRAAYAAEYKGVATSLAAEAYTGMKVLLEAIDTADSRSSEDVGAALRATSLETPIGTIKFDKSGQNVNAAVELQQVQSDGSFAPAK